MAKRRIGMLAVLLSLLLGLMPCVAQAASTADAKEPIVPDRVGSLSIAYGYGDSVFADLPVKLYRIAEVSADFQYTLTPSFAATGLILNGIQSVGEWDVIRSTLEARILADGIAPEVTVATDPEGQAEFAALTTGLYLATVEPIVHADATYVFDSALVALPGLGEDGLWQYEVAVAAKAEALPPPDGDDIAFKVLKLWRGNDGHNRPTAIEVDIFRGETLYQTVTLSEENHWSYSWSAEADGARWTVVERNVPQGYVMTVEERETAFVVTNTWVPDTPDEPDAPSTGDTSRVWVYVILMNVAGLLLVILGMVEKRKRV